MASERSSQDLILWALGDLKPTTRRKTGYAIYKAYYEGDHRLAFATKKFRTAFWDVFKGMRDNLCESVIDIQAERLDIEGFTTSTAKTILVDLPQGGQIGTVEDRIGEKLWSWWESQDMDIVADEVHKNSLLYGDGFALLEEDEDGDPTLWCQEPWEIAVLYSDQYKGLIEAAAKIWRDGKYWRLNVYTPSTVYRYRTINEISNRSAAVWQPSSYAFVDDPQTHDFGFVPVFHFPNKVYGRYGRSELHSVIPLQDALNKEMCDLLVASEFQAFRQRWMTGVEIETDPTTGKPKPFPFEPGADRILTLADPDSKVGEFGQTDMNAYISVLRDYRIEIARVAGVPLHYFFVGGQEAPSGEALKTAEIRFTKKMNKKTRLCGKIWENVLKSVIGIQGTRAPKSLDINAVWCAETARSESEILDSQIKKRFLGVPTSQLQREIGYDPEQIMQFAEERAANPLETAPTPAVPNPEKLPPTTVPPVA